MSDPAMTEEKGLLAALPCPFCGATMKPTTDKEGEFWMHPGFVTDGECFMSGKGIMPRQLVLWNTRPVAQDGAADALREALAKGNMAEVVDHGVWSLRIYFGGGDQACHDMRNLAALLRAALTAQAHPAGDDGEHLRETLERLDGNPAMEKIAILSNQDWTLARLDMGATLDMIHEIAVGEIYPASVAACSMCDDTGYKDKSGFALDACNHGQPGACDALATHPRPDEAQAQIVVSQAAREAAADLLGGATPDGLLEGKHDSLSLIRTLARFEAETLERAAKVADERAGEWQFAISNGLKRVSCGPQYAKGAATEAEVIAAAIRQLKGSGDE